MGLAGSPTYIERFGPSPTYPITPILGQSRLYWVSPTYIKRLSPSPTYPSPTYLGGTEETMMRIMRIVLLQVDCFGGQASTPDICQLNIRKHSITLIPQNIPFKTDPKHSDPLFVRFEKG